MSTLRFTPAELQIRIADGLAQSRALAIRQEALEYEALESSFPPVGNSAADWDTFADGDFWTDGPAFPRGATFTPPIPFLVHGDDVAPPAVTDQPSIDELLTEALDRNASKSIPRPCCKSCGWLIHEEDSSQVFPGRCDPCALNHLDRLLSQAIDRRGRKATLRALKRLAR